MGTNWQRCLIFALPFLFGCLVSPTRADSLLVTAHSASVDPLATPPASVKPGALASPTQIFGFFEQQNVALSSSLKPDITQAGVTFSNFNSLPAASPIPAGTPLDMYFLTSNNSTLVTIDGSITFNHPILGVDVLDSNLDATDFLGAPGTMYPTGTSGRGYENDGDQIMISADRQTLTIVNVVADPGDQVRIFFGSVPEPSSLVLAIAAGLCCLGWRLRFRRWLGVRPGC